MAQLLQDQPFNGNECMSLHLRRTRKHLKLAQQHIEEQVNENLQYGCRSYPRPFPRSPLSCSPEDDPPDPFDSVKEQDDDSLMASTEFDEATELIEEGVEEEEEASVCMPELPRKTVTFSETPGDCAPRKPCGASCSECNLTLMRRPPPYQRLDHRHTQTNEKCIRVQQVPFERRHGADDDSLPYGCECKAIAKVSSCDPLFNMYQAVYILGCLMWTAVFIRLVTM